MKTLCAVALAAMIASPATASPADQALSKIPSLSELCGSVPSAPVRTHSSSGRSLLNEKAKDYVRDTEQWLACSEDSYVKIQGILADVETEDTSALLVAHLNADYEAHYDELNKQLERFEHRANFNDGHLSQAGLLRHTRDTNRCYGTKQQQSMCFLRKQEWKGRFQAAVLDRKGSPVNVTKVTPPSFGD
ncbi:hypothetical protein [Kordiimonas aestuarii]|uniref:hypothetical protein n=1 Tax=Kordiimonas aestuarii TaxID=1005925 RepID=UPI0021D1B419|nr:hypothetical protein [Kordiimonas aestuarii]